MNLLRRIVTLAGTAWLIVGIGLLLAVLLEGLYLTQAGVRRIFGDPAAEGPPHPNAGQAWWAEWVEKKGAVNGPSRYEPYRGWWALPYASRFVHVDSAGHRVSVPGPEGPAGPRVLFLGGSVMWGYSVPDSLTIPSLVSRQLHGHGFPGGEVVNLAQPSYNTTQGLITLLLALRGGERFDAVVSLDGNNDVLAAVTEGHPGAAFGEVDLARRSAVGWRGFWSNVVGLVRYSDLFARLARFGAPSRAREVGEPEQPACDTVAAYYTNLVGAVETLGRSHGFRPLLLWQPHWATTKKALTAWERTIRGEPAVFPALMRACTGTVETLLSEDTAGFLSLTPLFDQDTSGIFLDQYGHLTPEGNARIADRISQRLLKVLPQAKASRQ